MKELTQQDMDDRTILNALFEKRKQSNTTKEGFFYFENQEFLIAQGEETYVVVAGDMAVGFPLFMEGESDFSKFLATLSLLRQIGRPTLETVWDVGANVGSICIPAVRRGFVKKAIAFEPESKLFRLLRANAILNGVESRIAFHNVALGAKRSHVDLTMGVGNTGDYRIAGLEFDDDCMGESSRVAQRVEVRPMDDFIEEFNAQSTLIYMDIQGYEGVALRGGARVLDACPPLVAEFWPYGMKRLESYVHLRDSICGGRYTMFADLSNERAEFEHLSATALDMLYERLGENAQASTDLLFV
jgi:FkbM family methyltransferase